MNALNAGVDLFDDLPINLPSLVDGESLYSWCARYHRLSGNAIASHSCAQLFGIRHPGLKHDFPKHLGSFCERTRNTLGTPEALALDRTLLGYYAPFITLETYRRALECLCNMGAAEPKHILGLMASRVGASHPLKACPECIRQDLKDLGFSRWILEHQWPSVWICRHHGHSLMYLAREFQPRELRDWTLPEDHSSGEWRALPKLKVLSLAKLARIASVTASIAQTPMLIDDESLRIAYRIGARNRGWVAFDGSLRMLEMTKRLQELYGHLVDMPGFGFLVNADPNGGGVLGLLTRRLPGLHHPAKHAVLIAFLFESVGQFIDAYRTAEGAANCGEIDILLGDWHGELRRLVESEKWSVSRAAKTVGIPVAQACRWLNLVGVSYEHRPRVLDDEIKSRLNGMLKAGDDYDQIAEVTGIKKSLVRAFAASNRSLRDAWRIRRFERTRDEHRSRAIALFKSRPGASIKLLKSVRGNGLAWLERHDHEWLTMHAPGLFAPVQVGTKSAKG